MSASDYLSNDGLAKWKEKLEAAVCAVHGDGSLKSSNNLDATSYFNDVSPYLIAYVIEPDINEKNAELILNSNPTFTYSGKYFASSDTVSSLCAELADIKKKKNNDTYGYKVPVGINVDANTLSSFKYSKGKVKYDLSNIVLNGDDKQYFFVSVDGALSSSAFKSNSKHYGGNDYGTSFEKYLKDVKEANAILKELEKRLQS
mgnify:FL=1